MLGGGVIMRCLLLPFHCMFGCGMRLVDVLCVVLMWDYILSVDQHFFKVVFATVCKIK